MVLRLRCWNGLSRSSFLCTRLQSTSATPLEESGGVGVGDGPFCVTSVNPITRERMIFELEKSSTKCPRTAGMSKLPSEAVEGLKEALVKCSRSVKQLQNEADQLKNVLAQRRFPATPEEIREARRRLYAEFAERDSEQLNEEELYSEKIKEEMRNCRSREVAKLLRRSRYNWRPMEFRSYDSAAVYSLARLAANYAEIRQVLREFQRVNFVPESVLDYGCGSGAGFWAANDAWGEQVREYQLVDPCEEISKFAMDVMRGSGGEPSRPLVHRNVTFRRHLAGSPTNTFDLIIAHRVLIEIASRDSRLNLISMLWSRANKFLVLIDSGLEESFNAVMEARDYILTTGVELHADETKEVLKENGVWNEKSEEILSDKNISHFERFSLIREMLPKDVVLPTRLPTGFVLAPCPHDQGCPKLNSEHKICKFSTHWPDLRADGKKTERSDGTSASSFSYVILQKGHRLDSPLSFSLTSDGERRPVEVSSRILESTQHSKFMTMTACTPSLGLQEFSISKAGKHLYRTCKARRSGDLLPINLKAVISESEYDVYKEAVKDFLDERQGAESTGTV